MKYTTLDSPLGPLLLARSAIGLAGLYLPQPDRPQPDRAQPGPTQPDRSPDRTQRSGPAEGWVHDPTAFADVTEQLAAYWAGTRQVFDLPLDLHGTVFQQAVWTALLAIPYGTTTSYGAIAARLNLPGGSRAVGLANGRNPVSLVVPCHRVIGSTGLLTGYGGGLPNKRFLLAHEAKHSPDAPLALF